MKKKVTWLSGKNLPTGSSVTTNPADERLLLVLVKRVPYPLVAIFSAVEITSKSEKRTIQSYQAWHIKHFSHDDTVEILAWRPMPKIPQEYQEVTGYDKIVEARERTKARKS
jgi:hypothetical protein